MYTDIPVLTKCCFFFPLRNGILVWAYLRLIVGILTLPMVFVFAIAYLAFGHPDTVTAAISLAILGLISVDLVFNTVLVFGCQNKSISILTQYCRCGVVYVVFVITLFITWLVHAVVPIWRYYNGIKYYNLESWAHITSAAGFVSFILLLHIYEMILVRSELVRLKSNCQFRFINHAADPECDPQPQEYAVK